MEKAQIGKLRRAGLVGLTLGAMATSGCLGLLIETGKLAEMQKANRLAAERNAAETQGGGAITFENYDFPDEGRREVCIFQNGLLIRGISTYPDFAKEGITYDSRDLADGSKQITVYKNGAFVRSYCKGGPGGR
jgi:hypothetical protein